MGSSRIDADHGRLRAALGALTLVALAVLMLFPAPGRAAGPALTASVVGEAPNGGGVFRFPQAVAFSPDGTEAFVGDQYSGQVQAFGRDGSFRLAIGARAARGEAGRLGVVGGVATDRAGHVYVLDAENDRVQVFAAADGRYLSSFGDPSVFHLLAGNPATGSGISASGIAVSQPTASAAPVVYVADQGNDRVARFTLDPGTLKPRGAPTFSDPSLGLSYPQGLAVNADGSRLYVADDDNHRVVVLDPATLGLIAQVGSLGTGPGQFQNPYDVAVDARNPSQLYVADNLNGQVDVFDAASLAFVTAFGRPAYGPGTGNFEIVRAVGAVGDDPLGGVAAADTANNRVQVLDAAGNVVSAWGIAGRGPGYVTRPGGAAFAPDGSVAVADSFDQRVERFDPDGSYGRQFGQISASTGYTTQGPGSGQFSLPFDVDYDSAGNLWVADTGNNRVQELGPDGAVRYTSPAGQLAGPRSVAGGADGSVYVADTGHGAVVQIAADGTVTPVLTGLKNPSAVAWNGTTLFAADATRVLEGPSGTPVAPPADEAAWDRPTGVAAAADGSLYVSEQRPGTPGGARVLRGTRTATRSVAWDTIASEGRGLGQVIEPANLSVSPSGSTLLVADTGNNRVVRLDAPGVAVPQTQPITVTIDQITRGIVTSDVPGIACVTDCQQSFGPGRAVTLTAQPVTGSVFNGWGGACAAAAQAPTCTLTTGTAQTASASFAVAPPPPPVAPPAPPPPPPPPPPVVITGVKIAPRVVHRARPADRHKHRAARRATKAQVTVTLSRPGSLVVGLQQGRPGRRQGSACRAPSSANRKGRRCTRYAVLPVTRTLATVRDTHVFHVSPALRSPALPPGSYRLSVVAVDTSGDRVGPRTVFFQVAR